MATAFDDQSTRRIAEAVQYVERIHRNLPGTDAPVNQTEAMVRAVALSDTSTHSIDGHTYYSTAYVQRFDVRNPGGWSNLGQCYAFEANGGTLRVHRYVGAVCVGVASDGKTVWCIDERTSSGGGISCVGPFPTGLSCVGGHLTYRQLYLVIDFGRGSAALVTECPPAAPSAPMVPGGAPRGGIVGGGAALEEGEAGHSSAGPAGSGIAGRPTPGKSSSPGGA